MISTFRQSSSGLLLFRLFLRAGLLPVTATSVSSEFFFIGFHIRRMGRDHFDLPGSGDVLAEVAS